MQLRSLSLLALFAAIVSPSLALETVNGGSVSNVVNEHTKATYAYELGYFGSGVKVANIEAGHFNIANSWLANTLGESGETLARFDDASYRYSGIGSLGSNADHATSVTQCLTALDPSKGMGDWSSTGMAPLVEMYSGAIAKAITGNNFSISAASLFTTYRNYFTTNQMDVINSSWGGSYTAATDNFGLVADSLIARSGTTSMVVASGNNGNLEVCTPATAYNSIAVGALDASVNTETLASYSCRGLSNFYNARTGQTLMDVVTAVDIVAPGTNFQFNSDAGASSLSSGTSYAAPTVAGGVALLIEAARDTGNQDACQSIATKAILLNSATKTAGWDNASTLTGEGVYYTAQGLDANTGAGALNMQGALETLVAENGSGWALGEFTITNNADTFNKSLGHIEAGETVALTLTWNVDRRLDDSSFATDTAFTEAFGATGSSFTYADLNMQDIFFADLCLELWTLNAEGMLDKLVAMSDAAYNNVEHIYFTTTQEAEYTTIVRYKGNAYGAAYDDDFTTTAFALAWSGAGLSIIPEPTTATLSLLALLAIAARRRRRAF